MLLKQGCGATRRSDQIRSEHSLAALPCAFMGSCAWGSWWRGDLSERWHRGHHGAVVCSVPWARCRQDLCLGCLPLLFVQPPAHPGPTAVVGSQGWSHNVSPLQSWRGRGWGPPLWLAPLQQDEGELCWKGQHHSAFPVSHGVLVGLCVSPPGWGVSSAAVTCSAGANPLLTVYCMFEGCRPYNLSTFTVAFRIKWLPSTLF